MLGVEVSRRCTKSEEKILLQVRSVRIFKKRASKNKNPDARNMLMARTNLSVLINFSMFVIWIIKICCDKILCELSSRAVNHVK